MQIDEAIANCSSSFSQIISLLSSLSHISFKYLFTISSSYWDRDNSSSLFVSLSSAIDFVVLLTRSVAANDDDTDDVADVDAVADDTVADAEADVDAAAAADDT